MGSSVDQIHTAEKRVGKNEDMSIETSQTKMQRKIKEKEQNIQEFLEQLQKVKHMCTWSFRKRRKRKRSRRNLRMADTRLQKVQRIPKNLYISISYLNYRKPRQRKS